MKLDRLSPLLALIYAIFLAGFSAGHAQVPDPLLLSHDTNPSEFSLSPNGKWILSGYWYKRNSLRIIDTTTFKYRDSSALSQFHKAFWGEDDNTLYAYDNSGKLFKHSLDNSKSYLIKLFHEKRWYVVNFPTAAAPHFDVFSSDLKMIIRCQRADGWHLLIESDCARLVPNEIGGISGIKYTATYDGRMTVRSRYSANGERILEVLTSTEDWKRLLTVKYGNYLRLKGNVRTDSTIWAISNAKRETKSLVRLNLMDGSEIVHFSNAKFDIDQVIFCGINNDPALVTYDPDYQAVEFFDKRIEITFTKLYSKLRSPVRVEILSHDADCKFMVVKIYSKDSIIANYVLNFDDNSFYKISASNLERYTEHVVESRPIEVFPGDGFKLQGYLTKTKSHRNNFGSTILSIHGGPYSRDVWKFYPDTMFFSEHGYNVIQINYRGSSGYNRTYREAIRGELFGAATDDIITAAVWAIENGYAERGKVVLYGQGYGGLLAINALARKPEYFSAAILISPLADVESYFKLLWGNTLGRQAVQYLFSSEALPVAHIASNSPINNIKLIRKPIMVLTGAKDSVIPVQGTIKYLGKIRKEGRVLSRHLHYRNLGHDIWKVNREGLAAMFGSIREFLEDHVEGQ